MNNEKVAQVLVDLARELVSSDKDETMIAATSSKEWKDVYKQLDQLRNKWDLTSDQSVFLGIVRDMALWSGKEKYQKVVSLAKSIESELNED